MDLLYILPIVYVDETQQSIERGSDHDRQPVRTHYHDFGSFVVVVVVCCYDAASVSFFSSFFRRGRILSSLCHSLCVRGRSNSSCLPTGFLKGNSWHRQLSRVIFLLTVESPYIKAYSTNLSMSKKDTVSCSSKRDNKKIRTHSHRGLVKKKGKPVQTKTKHGRRQS